MNTPPHSSIIDEVAGYYSAKIAQYGESPQGVDWNGEDGQILRFRQLCRVIESGTPFSLNDVGCGYGALYDALRHDHEDFTYTGIDISERMIDAASRRYGDKNNARFICAQAPDCAADYSVASGIFNVRQQRPDDEWFTYITDTLDLMHRTSRKGFSFNCLTSYSDPDRMRDYLYYADPCRLFDLCKRRYSRNVALLHDYDLYEFTVIVRSAT